MLAEILALLALAAPGAGAAAQSWTISDTSVAVSAEALWPQALNKGWWPLRVTVENGDERTRRVTLHADGWAIPRETVAELELSPGQRSFVELMIPAFANVQNSINLSVEVDGSRHHLSSGIGPHDAAGAELQTLLVLAVDLPAAGTSESWTEQLCNLDLDAAKLSLGETAIDSASPRGGRVTHEAASAGAEFRVQAARFDQMPARSEAYSSLDVVVLDTTQGLPEGSRLAPLLAWARLGGTLVVVGPRASVLARGVPEFALWMEPRFAATIESARLPGTAQSWRFGLGSLATVDEAALSSELQRSMLHRLAWSPRGIVEDPGGSRMRRSRPVIEDLFSLPLKVFALFLILFAVIIGPVNFLAVKRFRRPAVLLLTIPLIALVAAVGLFVVGVTSQGLGVKIATGTLAVLDQREHRVGSAEVRMIFAGLSPGPGLLPRPGSSCYFIADFSADQRFTPPSYLSRTFRVDQSEGLLLQGGFLPVREAFVQQILSEHAERARLAIQKHGANYSIQNGLGARIDQLVLRDPSGAYHRLASPLAIDARAELTLMDAALAEKLSGKLSLDVLGPELHSLPPACYLAALEHSPFGDDLGVTGTTRNESHALLGVLALDAEDWK